MALKRWKNDGTKVTDLRPRIEFYHKYYPCEGNKIVCSIFVIELALGTIVAYVMNFGSQSTRLTANINGRHYEEIYTKAYSKRFCTTLAKRFMAEVIKLSKQSK